MSEVNLHDRKAMRIKESLMGQFKLWHGIIMGAGVIIFQIASVSWNASKEYSHFSNRLMTLEIGDAKIENTLKDLNRAVLTNNEADKRDWLAFRENTVTRMSAYDATQLQILEQLREIQRLLKK